MDPVLVSAIQKLQWGAERSDSMSVDVAPAECDALLAYLDELRACQSTAGAHIPSTSGAAPEPATIDAPSTRMPEYEFQVTGGKYRGVAFRRDDDRDFDIEIVHVETKQVIWRGVCAAYKVWTWAAHLSDYIDEIESRDAQEIFRAGAIS